MAVLHQSRNLRDSPQTGLTPGSPHVWGPQRRRQRRRFLPHRLAGNPDPLHLLPEFRCQGGALVFHLRQPLLELPQRLGYRGQAQFRGAIGLFRLFLQGIRRQGPELVGELFAVRGDVRGPFDGGIAFGLGACRAGGGALTGQQETECHADQQRRQGQEQ